MNTVSQNAELWNTILSTVSEEKEKTIFDAFFRNTKIYDVDGNKIYILCESKLTKEILRDRFSDYLSQKLLQHTSTNYVPVFVTSDDIKEQKFYFRS